MLYTSPTRSHLDYTVLFGNLTFSKISCIGHYKQFQEDQPDIARNCTPDHDHDLY